MLYKIDKISTYKDSTFSLGLNFKDLILILMGYFLGRSVIMYETSPFIFPFVAYIIIKRKKPLLLITPLIGLIMVHSKLYVFRGGITFLIMYIVLDKWSKNDTKTWKLGLLSTIPVFLIGLIYIRFRDNHLYDLVLVIFESIITFISFYIFNFSLPLILGWVKRRVVGDEELICTSILISIILLGMNDFKIYNYSMKNVLGITLILIFARYFGSALATVVGVIIGVVTSLSSIISPETIGVYALSGLLAGIFKDMGKIPVGVGFILGNAVLTFYINGSTETFIHIGEILMAIGLLLLLPKGISDNISKLKTIGNYQIEREKLYGDRIREVSSNRLREYSKVFSQIGKSFDQIATSEALSSKEDFEEIFERLTKGICNNCTFYDKCWKLNLHSTYQEMFFLLTSIEKGDQIGREEKDNLVRICAKSDMVFQELLCLYGNYKSNQYWKRQVVESKALIAGQMKGLSNAILDLREDVKKNIYFNKEAEQAIIVAFDKNTIPIKDVMVVELEPGRYDITIYSEGNWEKRNTIRTMEEVLSKTLDKEIIFDESTYYSKPENKYKLNFREAIKHKISMGIIKEPKTPNIKSGDNYTSISLRDDKHMIALSDGMGSGERAYIESKTTINLLEKFFEAGFNREIALKTINSILMLRSNDEIFSTIDLAIFDKYSGEVEFIKIGAVTSFIKSGDNVEAVDCNSLPVGILEEVNISLTKRRLKKGDMIIMVTDGALSVNGLIGDKEKWFLEELKKTTNKNPQKLAEELFTKIKEKNKDQLRDDTTILVAKIW